MLLPFISTCLTVFFLSRLPAIRLLYYHAGAPDLFDYQKSRCPRGRPVRIVLRAPADCEPGDHSRRESQVEDFLPFRKPTPTASKDHIFKTASTFSGGLTTGSVEKVLRSDLFLYINPY